MWPRFEVFGQPVVILMSSDDVIVGGWYGAVGEETLRSELDRLTAIG